MRYMLDVKYMLISGKGKKQEIINETRRLLCSMN